ncbi:hypothetical protein [Sphaerisporangium sp. NPDC051011]|uniref:hypothetical protein n=1 Tax=Sphaerisporangium sp. NPDC051011 TaxID=3155792 RepID=UPI003402E3C6
MIADVDVIPRMDAAAGYREAAGIGPSAAPPGARWTSTWAILLNEVAYATARGIPQTQTVTER